MKIADEFSPKGKAELWVVEERLSNGTVRFRTYFDEELALRQMKNAAGKLTAYTRADLYSTQLPKPSGYVEQMVGDAMTRGWQGTCRIVPNADKSHPVPVFLEFPNQTARISELERHVEELQAKIYPDTHCCCSYDEPGQVCEYHSSLIADFEAKVREALSGIDKEEDDGDGWWETSAGAKFGAERLNKVISLIQSNLPMRKR